MMGILDDAIRQHLELKRRQGAADDELARLEDEAFGPPTRPGEPDFPGAAPAAEAPAPAELQPTATAEQTDEPPGASAAQPQPDEGGLDERTPESEVDLEELELELDDEFPELDQLEAGKRQASSPETVEHPAPPPPEAELAGAPEVAPTEAGEDSAQVVTPAGGADESIEDEDVLEETPEFLRDQPEDDELWFEQGEPKDFDF